MNAESLFEFAASFWARVDRTGGEAACWPWLQGVDPGGYGRVQIGDIKVGTHRVAFALTAGKAIAGAVVRHSCDNPRCCNPSHLLAGSQRDNMRDRQERGRQASGERNGRAKVNAGIVVMLRAEYTGQRGEITSLGREYGINAGIVRAIVTRKTWKHIAAPGRALKEI